MEIPDVLNASGGAAGGFSPGVLAILGLCVAGGMAGAWFFQKIRFPQVVGYIFIGLLIGDTGLGLVHASDVENLRMLNLFALGIIGFLVGGELRFELFRRYAREFMTILFGEGLAAFAIVGALCGAIVYCITRSFAASLAAGMVFGAIASATDPASTIDVIWEYRAKGVMTAAIIAIVALDDALALTLYGIGTSSAQLVTSSGGSVADALKQVGFEIFGALGLGAAFALVLIAFLRCQQQGDRAVAVSIGVILLVIGTAAFYNLDVILAAMMVGFILTNLAPRRSEEMFKLMRSFSIPIYVLFFVFVGARLDIWDMPGWLWLIALAYVVGRSFGKWSGSWLGAKIVGSAKPVRKYLGLGIFAQGGVAIGLSIVAAENLKSVMVTDTLSLGDMIVYVVTATTLILQFLGPSMVKMALRLSGEAGRDVTAEDVMRGLTVGDVMTQAPVMFPENMSVAQAFKIFSGSAETAYPVIGDDGRVIGILTFDALKNVAGDYPNWCWMLVADAMLPVTGLTTPGAVLLDVYNEMRMERHLRMIVVDSRENMHGLGVLDQRTLELKVEKRLLVITSGMSEQEACR